MFAKKPLIEIRNLKVEYWQQSAWTTVIQGLCLHVNSAETFGLVGESGCGKTTTGNSLLGYCPPGCRYREGSVWFDGRDLLALPSSELQRLRGRKVCLVPQNPSTALSPGMKVGKQILETLHVHGYCSTDEEARRRTLDLFGLVNLPFPEKIFNKYPHQLSGGQQQRVIIAMALACDPQLIVLDEPTTGLDVTTQAQILDLLATLRSQLGIAMFYITHNLGVVAQICSRIGVMYAGQLVESAPTRELFQRPQHPYAQGLIASVPSLSAPTRKHPLLLKGLLRRNELPPGCQFAPRCDFALKRCFEEPQTLTGVGVNHWVACWRCGQLPSFAERLSQGTRVISQGVDLQRGATKRTLLTAENLCAGYSFERTGFAFRRSPKSVIDGISLDIRAGETLALVGESGSGKTTVARALAGLLPYATGKLQFGDGYDLTVVVDRRSGELLRSIQFVFQNPDASLNPRHRVSEIIGRPLVKFFGLSGEALRRRIQSLLEDVHLDRNYANRFPDELSGGERQRIAIARALAAGPELLLCDEILSALDVSVQSNILELLDDLQTKHDIAFLFISHDLAVVRSLAHRVAVMYRGSLCEVGTAEELFAPPFHPYVYLLLSSVPQPEPEQSMSTVRKDIGTFAEELKTGCPFAHRCQWKVGVVCEERTPPWQSSSDTHRVRCHIPLDTLGKTMSMSGSNQTVADHRNSSGLSPVPVLS